MSPPSTPRRTYRTEWVERWCPPKSLVGLPPIERVLNRHTFMVCPESRLVVAMITRAIGDCLSQDRPRQRREARRFLLGPLLDEWSELVGLHPDFVRFVARKAGYLADENAHWQKVPIKVPVQPTALVEGGSGSIHLISCEAQSCQVEGEFLHA